MSVILGVSGALGHDASAALLIDGELIAAAEEERFTRDKHARHRMPLEAARYCLREAGLRAEQVQTVAFPFAPISLMSPARWHYARRHWYAPDRALDALLNGNRRYRRFRRRVLELAAELGIDATRTNIAPVEHHLAHASSAYHLSGFAGPTAIFCIDGKGEYASTLFAVGDGGRIRKLKEFYDPDSLGGVYGAITEYLGFEMLDGEYKVMGMASYGDAQAFDLSKLMRVARGELVVDTRLVNTIGLRRFKAHGRGHYFSRALVKWLGPPREDEGAAEPYIHYAAALQRRYEEVCVELVQRYLGATLSQCGQLVLAGGGALNVKLNQRLLAMPGVTQLFVQPAAGDAGTALGAATYVAQAQNERVRPLAHVLLGPAYDNAACERALVEYQGQVFGVRLDDVVSRTCKLLLAGHPVAWFHGRMEFGPRALGARSILAAPQMPGIADRINAQIKFREKWRPFCPSVLPEVAKAMTNSTHDARFMTITFDIDPAWRARLPEVVHVDGTARLQVVDARAQPRFYALLESMQRATGIGAVLNTSLNRRGEPIVCTPNDALRMFVGCDLNYLVLEDWLVAKREADL